MALQSDGASRSTEEKLGGQACDCVSSLPPSRLYNGRSQGSPVWVRQPGDRIGCGIEPVSFDVQTAQIFFTKNGKCRRGHPGVGFKCLKQSRDLCECCERVCWLGLA